MCRIRSVERVPSIVIPQHELVHSVDDGDGDGDGDGDDDDDGGGV